VGILKDRTRKIAQGTKSHRELQGRGEIFLGYQKIPTASQHAVFILQYLVEL